MPRPFRKALRLVPQGQPRRSPLRWRRERAREFGPSLTRIRRVGSGRGRNGFKQENRSRARALANPRTRADNKTPAACATRACVNHFDHVALAAWTSGSPDVTVYERFSVSGQARRSRRPGRDPRGLLHTPPLRTRWRLTTYGGPSHARSARRSHPRISLDEVTARLFSLGRHLPRVDQKPSAPLLGAS